MRGGIYTRLLEIFRGLPKSTRDALEWCLYGIPAGVGATMFLLAVNFIYKNTIERFAAGSLEEFLIGTFVTIVVVSLISGWLLSSYCPEAAGSGIPQHKLAFWKDFGYVPWRIPIIKFIAGALSVGGGVSLGREGPSVQLAGGLASGVAGLLGEPKQNRRAAAAAGAAAGLAAAFNTPLAAMVFVLEEIITDLNSRYFFSALVASGIGALVVQNIIGPYPAFLVKSTEPPSWAAYLLTPLVSAVAGMVGVVFHRGTIALREIQKRWPARYAWLYPTIGGLITWILGVGVFLWSKHLGVFGLGYTDLTTALAGGLEWKIALVLLITKLVATIASYGFGGCGGIFAPTLFMGGMVGVVLSALCGMVISLRPEDQLCLTVVGMAACLNGVVLAPITGILIVFEMTHDFALVPALMVGALVSYSLAKKINRINFYEELLEQDGHRLERIIPPRDLDSWQHLPVTAIANFQPVVLQELSDEAIRKTLEKYPYERFPVVQNGKILGILTRREAEEALAEMRPPVLEPAVTCTPSERIQDLQHRLIHSTANMVLLVEPNEGKILGLVTLHDLLRAQVLMTQVRA